MRLTAAATLVALTSLATGVRAQPPGLTPVVTPEPVAAPPPDDYVDSYRGQVLGADGIAVGLVIVAAMSSSSDGRSSSTSLLELSLATYLLGGPLIHLLHDRPGHAAASLGLRIGLPVILAFAGAALASSNTCSTCDDEGSAGEGGAALGAIIGGVAAVIIDAAVFARGDDRPSAAHLTAMPLRGGGVSFGVASTF